jgi:hypothetical protein
MGTPGQKFAAAGLTAADVTAHFLVAMADPTRHGSLLLQSITASRTGKHANITMLQD